MTERLDAVEYKNGQKNNWRLNAWNRIADFTHDRKNALVLYLPGSRDLDSFVAVRKGFRSANLIAVEREDDVAKALRDGHRTTICSDLNSVVASWPRNHKVSVVIADMQCGFVSPILDLIIFWMGLEAFSGGTLLLNLQRGREGKHDPVSDLRGSYTTCACEDCRGRRVEKNRGWMAVATMESVLGAALDIPSSEGNMQNEVFRKLYSWKYLPTYRSSPNSPYFDSVVVKNIHAYPRRERPDGSVQFEDVRSKISAALALRTMRLSGQLACA